MAQSACLYDHFFRTVNFSWNSPPIRGGSGSALKTSFVLVDFENVQPKDVGLLGGGPFKIKVFLGTNQAKIPLEMAHSPATFGSDAEYIQIDGNGSNALDFHIAYYVAGSVPRIPAHHFMSYQKTAASIR